MLDQNGINIRQFCKCDWMLVHRVCYLIFTKMLILQVQNQTFRESRINQYDWLICSVTLELKDTGWREQSGHTRGLQCWPLFLHLQHCSKPQWTGRHPSRRLQNLPATGTPGKSAALTIEKRKKRSWEDCSMLHLYKKNKPYIVLKQGL